MEYVPGGTVERFCAPEKLLPVDEVVDIVFKCTRALAYAHMHGVAHRDIKPGNILYAAAPTDVRISDFGLALNVGAQTTQITGVGSPAYMSPEQIREDAVDHRTDLYSLGVVMYQLLVGKLPFQATNKFAMIYQITQVDPIPPSSARHGSGPARPCRAPRHAQGQRPALPQRRRIRRRSLDALRAGRGERKDAFGDADKFAALRALRFFASFSDAELWEVVALAQWEKAPQGTVLLREGERGDFFCVVLGGEVRVTKNKKLLSVLGPGECFGEMAYLSLGSPLRGATVSAAADSRIFGSPLARSNGRAFPAAAGSTAPSSAFWSSG